MRRTFATLRVASSLARGRTSTWANKLRTTSCDTWQYMSDLQTKKNIMGCRWDWVVVV